MPRYYQLDSQLVQDINILIKCSVCQLKPRSFHSVPEATLAVLQSPLLLNDTDLYCTCGSELISCSMINVCDLLCSLQSIIKLKEKESASDRETRAHSELRCKRQDLCRAQWRDVTASIENNSIKGRCTVKNIQRFHMNYRHEMTSGSTKTKQADDLFQNALLGLGM